MTETHEQRVERLARAVCVADGLYDGNDDGGEIFDTDPDLREAYRRTARAVIASDREAGYVTVPQSLLDDARDAIETGVRLIERNQEAFEQIKGAMDTIHMLRARPWWKRLFSPAITAHEQEER